MLVISARLAPFPPSRNFIPLLPSAKSYTYLVVVIAPPRGPGPRRPGCQPRASRRQAYGGRGAPANLRARGGVRAGAGLAAAGPAGPPPPRPRPAHPTRIAPQGHPQPPAPPRASARSAPPTAAAAPPGRPSPTGAEAATASRPAATTGMTSRT